MCMRLCAVADPCGLSATSPVPKEALERVLAAATRAPSSGNLQPWHVYAVAGEPLAELKEAREGPGTGRRPG